MNQRTIPTRDKPVTSTLQSRRPSNDSTTSSSSHSSTSTTKVSNRDPNRNKAVAGVTSVTTFCSHYFFLSFHWLSVFQLDIGQQQYRYFLKFSSNCPDHPNHSVISRHLQSKFNPWRWLQGTLVNMGWQVPKEMYFSAFGAESIMKAEYL